MFGFKKKLIDFEDLPSKVQDALEMIEISMMEGEDPTETFRQIAKKYPGFIPARLNLASVLLDAGNLEEAKATYKNVLKQFPDEIGAIAGLSTVFSAQGNHDQAEEFAAKAIAGGYEWPACYKVIANAREANEDLDGAAQYFLSGYELSPHCWDYLENYCRLTDQPFTPPTEEFEQFIS